MWQHIKLSDVSLVADEDAEQPKKETKSLKNLIDIQFMKVL